MGLFGSLARTVAREAVRHAPEIIRAARRTAQQGGRPRDGRSASGGPGSVTGTRGSERGDRARPGTGRAIMHEGHRVLPDRPSSPPLALAYRPRPDDLPDPGEVVWTWVHYEEDLEQGKDRPVLVLAREHGELVCLMLSSKDHVDGDGPARYGEWVDVGSGDWDPKHRPSEVRTDRLLVIDPESVRRIGAALDEEAFAAVAESCRTSHGW